MRKRTRIHPVVLIPVEVVSAFVFLDVFLNSALPTLFILVSFFS